jgi:hypothetical protein
MWYCTGFQLMLLLIFINQKSKNMKKLFLAAVLFTAILTSCKKDSTPDPVPAPIVYAEENPLPTFLSTTGFNQLSTVSNYGATKYEEGFTFKANVKGKINAMVMKLPVANSSLRITIWDNVSKAVLRTENINIPTANTEATIAIATFDVVKDKEYFISMWTSDDFQRSRTDNAAAAYPIVSGNISILGYLSKSVASGQVFPTNVSSRYYYGDLSFKFQRTE